MRAFLLTVAPLLLAGCGASTPPAPTPTLSPAGPQIHFTNTTTSGASAPAQLAAGTYSVAWDVSDGDDTGCTFFLFLTTSVDGPTVATIMSGAFIDSKGHSGTSDITVPSAGMYLLQEDQSGLSSCHRLWSADLTLQ